MKKSTRPVLAVGGAAAVAAAVLLVSTTGGEDTPPPAATATATTAAATTTPSPTTTRTPTPAPTPAPTEVQTEVPAPATVPVPDYSVQDYVTWFMEAYLRDGIPQQEWFDAVRLHATDDLAGGLAYTDPAAIPTGELVDVRVSVDDPAGTSIAVAELDSGFAFLITVDDTLVSSVEPAQ